MDKLATDTGALQIGNKRRRQGIYIVFFVSMCFSFCFFWLLSHLFTDILHALGDNDVTFHEIFSCFIIMEFVPFYFVYKYYYSKDLELETDRLREALKRAHDA